MRKGTMFVLFLAVSLVFMACGGQDKKQEIAEPVQEAVAQPVADGAGVLLAKEILGSFDELVAKVAELAKEKPDVAVLKPQLEELYSAAREQMNELNGKYLALRDSDMPQFGACNGYLGEHRGKHVFKKDTDLGEIIAHYNLQIGDAEMVKLISEMPVELLEAAVTQG